MLTTIFIILVLILILSVCLDWDEAVSFLSGFVSFVLFIALIFCFCIWCSNRSIPDKIAVYQAQNEKIESDMDALVQKYMDYESSTFEKFSDSDGITLVQLLPELKANELVQQELRQRVNNNNDIKDLQCKLAEAQVFKWLLYFG